jgi:hypothetical protein
MPTGGGYTGKSGHGIWAQFGADTRHVVRFDSYGVARALPSGLRLPCGGSGRVTFTTCFGTLPCSADAHDDHVGVTYENIAV